MADTVRPVIQVVTAHQQREGGGFVVRRPFPGRDLFILDPLLLLDELGPIAYPPGRAVGAPDHPHRGMETVTYLLEGESAHADSAGNAGTLRPGDVQWMTAGAGVVHREMPSRRMQEEGGRSHGFQLWVNLPASAKMSPPRYQELSAASIPEVTTEDGRARGRIVAGEALGASAPTATHVPIDYHHWTLDAGASLTLPVAADHNVGVYVFEGTVAVAGETVTRGQFAVLGGGDVVALAADAPAQLLLLGGRPIGEPVAWRGPFVMNTDDELLQALEDYRAGRMGRIPPEIVRA
jgi:redox-sensitive bicupin YhaK (pirin superfamily)